jgi:HEAT repeat protein
MNQWIDSLQSADAHARSRALRELQQLGPKARTAVPALLTALEQAREDRNLAAPIAETLAAIGPDARAAVPLLVTLVNPHGGGVFWGSPPDGGVDHVFPLAILRIGGEPAQERLAMRSLLKVVRGGWDAYPISLWRDWEKELMRPCADRLIPCLVGLLNDPDELTRSRAAETLAGYGTQAARAVPALVAALKDSSFSERIQACQTLRQVGEDPVAHLLPLLRQHTGESQMPYIETLRAIGEPSLPALREELRGPSVAGRVGAARALGLLASHAQAAWEDLLAALQDPDAEVRGEAAQALVGIDAGRAGPALPHLICRLDSADVKVRANAVDLLVRLGPGAEPALPALANLLTDPDVGKKAALALVAISARQAAPAVPVLVDALERLDPASSSAPQDLPTLLAALGRIGVPAASAAPLIRTFFQHSDATVRMNTAAALKRIAPEAPEWKADAVSSLLAIVADVEDPDGIFWEALAALGECGAAARKVVPQLEMMLFEEEKRGMAGVMCPGDPVAMLFSALVRIDSTAAAGVLRDRRAEAQWDSLLLALGELGLAARPLIPVLEELLPSTAPDKADNLKALLSGIKRGLS